MKKFFLIWCAVMVAAILMGVVACASAETYPQTFVVIDTDYTNDVLVMMDFNGNVWEWEGVEDWDCGDVGSAIMEDNDTPIIYDDAIIDILYTGLFDGWIERVCR